MINNQFTHLTKILNDEIVDPSIKDGKFHYIIIPKKPTSAIRIDNRLYKVSYSSNIIDDFGDSIQTIDEYLQSLIKIDNLEAYGVIKYTNKGLYIFGVSHWWFFEIKNNHFHPINIVLNMNDEDGRECNGINLYSPTYCNKQLTCGPKIGTALLSRYGSADIVIASGRSTTANLETNGYSVGFTGSKDGTLYHHPLDYRIRVNIPNTVPEENNPTIILKFSNKDEDRDIVYTSVKIEADTAFDGLYEDMIDIPFRINSNAGTTITITPHKIIMQN